MRLLLVVFALALACFIAACGQTDSESDFGRERFDTGWDVGHTRGYAEGFEVGYDRGYVEGVWGGEDACLLDAGGEAYDRRGCAMYNCYLAGVEPTDCRFCTIAGAGVSLEQALSSEPADWEACKSP